MGHRRRVIFNMQLIGSSIALVTTLLDLLLFYIKLLCTLSPLLHVICLNPSLKWFVFKRNSEGLKCEIAMVLQYDKIVWMHGPFPASKYGITIFWGGKVDESEDSWDKEELYCGTKTLSHNIQGVGDSDYAGEPWSILNSKKGQAKEFLAVVKRHDETLHTHFNCWNILENWCHWRYGT